MLCYTKLSVVNRPPYFCQLDYLICSELSGGVLWLGDHFCKGGYCQRVLPQLAPQHSVSTIPSLNTPMCPLLSSQGYAIQSPSLNFSSPTWSEIAASACRVAFAVGEL